MGVKRYLMRLGAFLEALMHMELDKFKDNPRIHMTCPRYCLHGATSIVKGFIKCSGGALRYHYGDSEHLLEERGKWPTECSAFRQPLVLGTQRPAGVGEEWRCAGGLDSCCSIFTHATWLAHTLGCAGGLDKIGSLRPCHLASSIKLTQRNNDVS